MASVWLRSVCPIVTWPLGSSSSANGFGRNPTAHAMSAPTSASTAPCRSQAGSLRPAAGASAGVVGCSIGGVFDTDHVVAGVEQCVVESVAATHVVLQQ